MARVMLVAADGDEALAAAERRREAFVEAENVRVGRVVPLTPGAPGSHAYRVSFTTWRDEGEGYRKCPMSTIEVWALSAGDARQLGISRAQALHDYVGSWRVERVERVGAPDGSVATVRRADPRISQSHSLRRAGAGQRGTR